MAASQAAIINYQHIQRQYEAGKATATDLKKAGKQLGKVHRLMPKVAADASAKQKDYSTHPDRPFPSAEHLNAAIAGTANAHKNAADNRDVARKIHDINVHHYNRIKTAIAARKKEGHDTTDLQDALEKAKKRKAKWTQVYAQRTMEENMHYHSLQTLLGMNPQPGANH